jgi:hypothetical protein
VGAWKAVIALAVAVAGAVGAFAVYTFGWRDDPGVRRANNVPTNGPRTYVLRDGDVVLRREAATRCLASQEGGFPNLFCARIGEGRHDVIFYSDVVQVWPHARGPDAPPFSYRWEPR